MPDPSPNLFVPPELLPAFRAVLEHVSAFVDSARSGEVDFATSEARLGELVSEAEGKCLGSMLRSLDPTEDRVEVDGIAWRRMSLQAGETYLFLRGSARVERGLYRREDVRNGPTIVPLDLRAGMVEGRYSPAAAKAAGILAQAHPSREADTIAKTLGVLPHSRSSQFRTGTDIGLRWEELRPAAEPAITSAMQIPKAAVSLSVAADRVSLPMAEPRALRPGEEVKRPIAVNFRMAVVGVMTFYDADGEALTCIRHGHVAEGGVEAVRAAMTADLERVLARSPTLTLVTLSDGAPEMQNLVDAVVGEHEVAARLTDFWHLAEKLGAAIRETGRYVPDLLGDWKADLLERDAAVEAIENTLIDWSREYPDTELPKALHEAMTYIANRRERLRYATPRAAGLPIGSGSAEATCKTLVTVRMRRSGASWTDQGAQAILGLRALATSSTERWDAAMDRVIASYKAHIKPLPPRTARRG